MSEQLVIYLHQADKLLADWVFTDANGTASTVVTSGLVSELVEKNQHAINASKTIHCIVPAELMFSTQVSIPAKNRQRALQAIPFALEDLLADDIEDCHFAVGSNINNSYPVTVIQQQRLESLLTTLKEAGIQPDTLHTDAACLNTNATNWQAIVHDNRAAINMGSNQLIAGDLDTLAFILNASIEQAEQKPETLLVHVSEDDAHSLNELSVDGVEISTQSFIQSPLLLLCKQLHSANPVNVLQGKYQVVKQTNQWWKPWKAAAIIAAAALILNLTQQGIELNQFKNENALMQSEINNIYKQSFPHSKKIVNARVQMESKLKQLKKNSGKADYSFTDILLDSAPIIQQTSSAEIQGINFHNRKLEIQLTLDKLSTAESLKDRLNRLAGVKAELVSASSEAKQVNARIRLEAI